MILRKRYFHTTLLSGVAATVLLSGCATTLRNPISDTLIVERGSTPDTRLWHTEVIRNADGKGITVSGELLPRWYLAVPPKGHVDIDIIAPDKTILQSRCVYYVTEHLSRKLRRYQFRVSIATVPPEHSVVRVTPHATALCSPSERA